MTPARYGLPRTHQSLFSPSTGHNILLGEHCAPSTP
eukprot:COSAG01_NODE_37865_length_497_cov_20.012563_1_plen_35_part_10